ncbi:hypothetical protein A8990_12651 [Paenibacillus taihuensis]|uniref:Uncharacterized protein n=1 Tax=Paenibacillus taihuensis TaxID=1156355 RepID=A0A3D9RIF4_9BACL|nr:hypothetical protein [Paenibacillus taihuensis]REE78577.1 hypothetical protein A8990_12651 [Paenibacillus taihuensis]
MQNLKKIFHKKNIDIKKGDILKITVCVDGGFEELVSDAFDFDVVLNSWGYMVEGKIINPFKLSNYTRDGSIKFVADIKFVRKAKDTDELR